MADEANVDVPEPTPDALLTEALSKAQGAFPPIDKRATASVQGKEGRQGYSYKYADIADVLAVVRPVLAEHGLAITQPTVRENGRLVLRTILRHVAGGELVSEVEITQAPNSPQQFGAALTYLRRYEVTTLLGIAAEEDRDAQDVEPPGRAQAPPPPTWTMRLGAETDKRALLGDLEALVGADRAKAIARGIATTYDGVPVIAADVVRALRKVIAPPPEPEPAAVAEARAIVEAQDAAAEASDIPTSMEPAADGYEAASVEEVQEEPEPEPDTQRLPPATVPMPSLAGLDEDQRIAALVRAGCTCPSPLGGEGQRDGACPLIGHGITL